MAMTTCYLCDTRHNPDDGIMMAFKPNAWPVAICPQCVRLIVTSAHYTLPHLRVPPEPPLAAERSATEDTGRAEQS